MRTTLTVLSVLTTPTGETVVLAMPLGGGTVEALTVSTAETGAREGWLEGYPPPAPEHPGLEQARQTQPEGEAA